MTILNRLWGKPDPTTEIKQQGFKISECSETCESCSSKFPSSLKFEEGASLWKSTKPYGLHIVVSTGKSDWPHDATGVRGTLSNKVSKWADDSKNPKKATLGNVKVTCSSLGSDELLVDDEYMTEKKGDILLLPYFIWVKGITITEVDSTLDKLIEMLVDKKPIPDIITAIPKVQVDPSKAYVFLCSHKSRDKRCGLTAPIMKKEMDLYLRELGLYRDFGDSSPGGVNVAFINHIGGHKFAANVIIYLKSEGKNIWLALCKPNNVKPIIDECIEGGGKVWPDKVRLVQKFDPIEW
ncbi:uncharacterized protein SPAPADRAFT_61961 [Spathaspora passalidarum NRRL Y-27907]|uniref:Actin patches distal protein 1 n=1 Tax=Spathaspora passalidarum (strain NRRL Y-27907 / 11-Y1) TaxID=619300 RepID=G3AQ48_SPAPN|nr:uncharacterized protein SPAPADRAFT_61961 [Spathaspora passalidarum NRRL Y-27907]EGW31394.1 hypothetical protein SPAPADRAFT_61961 [Spathaspora passalidarum NRRL Y-27907]